MFRKFTLFAISLLVAPGLGLFASLYGLNKLVTVNGLVSTDQLAAECFALDSPGDGACQWFNTLHLLYQGSLIALIVTLALPLVYIVAATILSRDRTLLARYFPPLVWVMIAMLPLILTAHGLLVWFASWELVQMELIPSDLRLMAVLAGLGGILILTALGIVSDMRRLLELDPLRATGVLLEKEEMPELFTRVARIAHRLGSREPQRIIIGIEPTAYVANVSVRLRGVGDLPVAETLYLSTIALRVLDDAELDALIAHELGHFRGADVEFSSRFTPAFRSLTLAAESVSAEDEEDSMSIALMPAIGLLSFMIYTLSRIVSRIDREREFAADQASLEVSSPQAIASLLVKFSVMSLEWKAFRYGVGVLLRQGVSRRNFSRDYLERTRQFLAVVDPDVLRRYLLEAHTPHPLDTHPSLTQRASAVGMDPAAAIVPSVLAMRVDRPASSALEAIEERITMIDADYYRHPANPVTISDNPELPPELTFVKA